MAASTSDPFCAAASAADALPYTVPVHDVRVEADVEYCRAEGYWTEGPDRMTPTAKDWFLLAGQPHEISLQMDIYTPGDDPSPLRPLLLMMHGGGFVIGSKNEKGQTEWCRYFASLGYVAASIDYRMGFKPTHTGLIKAEKDALEDARAALSFLLGRKDLRIDPDRVFAAGTSAGGNLALGLSYMPVPSVPCHILAAGNLWGYIRDLSILENASVPIVSFQSVQDPVVPYRKGYPLGQMLAGTVYGTKAVHDQATRLGIPCRHIPVKEKAHRLHLNREGAFTEHFYAIRDALTAFFAEAMQGCLSRKQA